MNVPSHVMWALLQPHHHVALAPQAPPRSDVCNPFRPPGRPLRRHPGFQRGQRPGGGGKPPSDGIIG